MLMSSLVSYDDLSSLVRASTNYRRVHRHNRRPINTAIQQRETAHVLDILHARGIPLRDLVSLPLAYIEICGARYQMSSIKAAVKSLRSQVKTGEKNVLLPARQRTALLTLTCFTGWTTKFDGSYLTLDACVTHRVDKSARRNVERLIPIGTDVICVDEDISRRGVFEVEKAIHRHHALCVLLPEDISWGRTEVFKAVAVLVFGCIVASEIIIQRSHLGFWFSCIAESIGP